MCYKNNNIIKSVCYKNNNKGKMYARVKEKINMRYKKYKRGYIRAVKRLIIVVEELIAVLEDLMRETK